MQLEVFLWIMALDTQLYHRRMCSSANVFICECVLSSFMDHVEWSVKDCDLGLRASNLRGLELKVEGLRFKVSESEGMRKEGGPECG